MVMGTDGAGACVYWTLQEEPSAWECLNDGSCERSAQGVHASEEDCKAGCGQGRWACRRQAGSFWPPRPATHFCEPSPEGECSDVGSCEEICATQSSTLQV